MKWALLLFLGASGAVFVAVSGTALLIAHRLRRRNRVDPHIASGAPLTWLVDPRPAARLHRRLARAADTAGTVADRHRPPPARRFRRAPEPPQIVELAADIRVEAVALDRHLTTIHRLAPGPRRAAMQQVSAGVTEIELAAANLTTISAEISSPRVLPHHEVGLADLGRRIDHLAAAHRELDRIDADAGLMAADLLGRPPADIVQTPEPVGSSLPPPPPSPLPPPPATRRYQRTVSIGGPRPDQ